MYCLSFYRVTDDLTRTEKWLVAAAAWLNNDNLWEYRTEWMFMSVPRTVAAWSLCGVDKVPGAHFHQRLLLAGPIGDCGREFPSAKTQWNKTGFKLWIFWMVSKSQNLWYFVEASCLFYSSEYLPSLVYFWKSNSVYILLS